MTQHDSPSLPAHRPGASRQAPDDTSPSCTTRPWMPALLYTLGFLTVYLLAICTPWGQRAENPWFYLGIQGGEAAWIYPLSGSVYGSRPLPPLELSAKPTVMAGLAVIVLLTLVRRCWRQGFVALGVAILAIGAKEVFKSTVPRPDLVGAPENLLDQGFPSGHTVIPAALTLAAVLVVSPASAPTSPRPVCCGSPASPPPPRPWAATGPAKCWEPPCSPVPVTASQPGCCRRPRRQAPRGALVRCMSSPWRWH